MRKTLTFEELWAIATTAAKACNGLTYHNCCDIWTSRSAKASRDSHRQKLQWKNIISTLDKTIEDKKQGLLAKMTEEGWRLPAVLNEACQVRLFSTRSRQLAFRHHISDQPPQELRVSSAPQNHSDHSLNCFFEQDSSNF